MYWSRRPQRKGVLYCEPHTYQGVGVLDHSENAYFTMNRMLIRVPCVPGVDV